MEKANNLLRKAFLLALPIVTVIVLASYLVIGKGTGAKATVFYEDRDFSVDKLKILEIVPDSTCQMQYAYLVTGQEPIADWIYSDDVNKRKQAYETVNYVDLANFGGLRCSGAPDYIWTNDNDFLNFIFDDYEVATAGDYVRLANTAYAKISSLKKFDLGGGATTYRCDATGNADINGEYVYTCKYNPGSDSYTEQSIEALYRDPETGFLDIGADGNPVTYVGGTKLSSKEIKFDCMNPTELNAKIAADPNFLVNSQSDGTGNYDMIVWWKGGYGHLEPVTASLLGGDPGAQYDASANSGKGPFSWATCKAIFEFVEKYDRPIQLDSSANGMMGNNAQKVYNLIRVLPYVSCWPVYEMLDPETGAWKSSISNLKGNENVFQDVVAHNSTGTYTLQTTPMTYNYASDDVLKYTAPNPWYTAATDTYELKLTDKGESLIYWFEFISGRVYADVGYDNSGRYSGLKDDLGVVYTYLFNGSQMDDLNENVFLFKGEDVSLGDNFKYNLFGTKSYFTEVVDTLDTVGSIDQVTNANTVKYLLNLVKTMSLKHDIRILEIEPSVEFKFAKLDRSPAGTNYKTYSWTIDDNALDELLVQLGYLPNEVGRSHIKVDYMTSAALAGFKDDLLNYSFIYIGDLNGDIATTVPAGAAQVIKYSYYGFALQDQAQSTNHGKTTIGIANYSGSTDITTWIKTQLEDYVRAGRVLMLAEKLYDEDHTKTVEEQSVMNDLVKSVKALDTRGLVVKDTYSSARMKRIFNLSSPMPMLEVTACPTVWDGTNFNASRTFSFMFDIKGNPNTNYCVDYYYDNNGDGRFLDATAGEDETEYIVTQYGLRTNSDGKVSSTYYYEVPSGKSGFIAWKMVVYPEGNKVNRVSQVGFTAVYPEKKEIINILQVEPIPSRAQTMPYAAGANAANSTFTLDNTPGDGYEPGTRTYETNFTKKLRDDVKDYDIHIYTVDLAIFKSWYNPSRTVQFYQYNSETGTLVLGEAQRGMAYDRSNPDTDRLTGVFDMIVIGFGDEFKANFVNDSCIFNIYDYAKAGYAVLMAHDVIYAFTGPDETGSSPGGYNPYFGLLFRDIAGMDRFGFIQNYLKNYIDQLIAANGANSKWKSVIPEQYDSDAYSALRSGVISNIIRSTDITPYAGYNNGWIMRCKVSGNSGVDHVGAVFYPYSSVKISGNENNLITRNTVRLNRGAVTEYPYVLKENIEVADTHSQYFSLNLEDEDVFVWYNLAGRSTGNNNEQIYNATHNSAWDNYYVYSAENIVYTGAGHNYNGANPTNDEMELFINTMVAAIRLGNHAPEIVISNATKSKESDCDYILYISETDQLAQLDYIVRDPDLIKGSTIRDVKVYLDNGGGANNGVYDEGSDVMLMHYSNLIQNDVATFYDGKNYNIAYLPSDTADGEHESYGVDYARVGYSINTTTLGPTGISNLSEAVNTTVTPYGENALYVNIQATDAKGATGISRVKIKFMDFYNLD